MIKIIWSGNDETIAYAAKEFKKYLDMVTGTLGYGKLCKADGLPEIIGENEIVLGLLDELGLDSSDVEDAELDDVEDVNIHNGKGYIAGSNPRSVLFGVYDYFKAKGCAWVRPGALGEHIVSFDPMEHTFVFRKKADIRFRGECLEGAVKYEHIRASVEWAPKVHMNLFMIQGIVPYSFMNGWYSHEHNTRVAPEDIGFDGIKDLTVLIEKDIRRCGMQLHTMGHGYLGEPYGIHFVTSKTKYEMNPRMEDALALVKGKREFYKGSPNWSQMCMSKDYVLRDYAKWLAEYAESKPWINFLNVWLGDGKNNHCECPDCAPHHPSDLYVKMLNMLDEELTARNLSTKIVFISYIDTLWAPIKERLNNPDRFILEIAISGRNYNEPYDMREYEGEIPTWERNNFNVGSDFSLRRKMLNEWKKIFKGPTLAFEYHFYTQHYNDPGTMHMARNFYADLHQLKALGLDGIMNCQTQRCAFPSAFPVAMTGESLFDLDRSYEELLKEYYVPAFGEKWEETCEYLDTLTSLFHPEILSGAFTVDASKELEGAKPAWFENKVLADDLAKIPAVIDGFRDVVEEGMKNEDKAIARSYKILDYHGDYCKELCDLLIDAANGNVPEAQRKLDILKDHVSAIEMEIEYELDLRLFYQCFFRKFKI